MRNTLILLALAALTVATTGCSRTRSLCRRGAPCGGTRLATPPMLGGAIPLGNPIAVQQPPQLMTGVAPNCCCEQAPVCCEPCCPTDCCPPCETGYIGDGDCGCQTAPGEYFMGYTDDAALPPATDGNAIQPGSGTYPRPTNN